MKHAYGVRMTTESTGTGTLTLASVSGFPTFSQGFGIGSSNAFTYSILHANGYPIEEGYGYLSDSTTLVRSVIKRTYVGTTYDDTSPTAVDIQTGVKTVINPVSAYSVDLGGMFRGENPLRGDLNAGDIFRVHEHTLNTNVTFASNENALCAGPLTIASGITVTVPSTSRLVVV